MTSGTNDIHYIAHTMEVNTELQTHRLVISELVLKVELLCNLHQCRVIVSVGKACGVIPIIITCQPTSGRWNTIERNLYVIVCYFLVGGEGV